MEQQNINPAESGNVNGANNGASGKSTADKTQKFRDNHSVTKRLQQELLALMTSGDKGISAFPESENLFKWTGTIHGAPDTIYEGLQYKMSLEFSSGYPYTAPVIKFLTPCFHPNVDNHGNICLDILKEKWSASLDVRTILLSVQSLLAEPNNESPLNSQAAELWPNKAAYKRLLLDKYRKHEELAQKS